MTIGERIKLSREKLGISQVELANSLQISKQNLYKYENNIITNIPSDKIEAIAKRLEVSPAYLMGWDDSYSNDMTIGERIKKIREEKNISVDKLAELIGKNRATIYRYESNEIEKLPTSVLEPLCKALGTTPAYIMGWDDSYSNDTTTVDTNTLENELKEYILTKFKSIRAFTQAADIPYSTVDTMIKKGIGGTGITTVSKICNTLSIDINRLINGEIVSLNSDKTINQETDINYQPFTKYGKRLYKYRREHSMSLAELATTVGVDENKVRQWESSPYECITFPELNKVAEVLQIDLMELLPDEDDPLDRCVADSRSIWDSKPCDPSQKLLLKNYNALNKIGKEKLIDYSDDLVCNGKYTDKNIK